MVCIDAVFAVNMDKSSHIGILAMIRDQSNGRCNIIHYASTLSKRVWKSLLAAKLFAFVDGYDVGYVICYALQDSNIHLCGRPSLTLYTEYRSLHGMCISLTHTTERRLLIDFAIIREAYKRQDISDIVWRSGLTSTTDDLKKIERRPSTLSKIIETDLITPEHQSWVPRDSGLVQTIESWR